MESPSKYFLADAAEALGLVRESDSAPYTLTWEQVLEEIRELREDRDFWKSQVAQCEMPGCKNTALPYSKHCSTECRDAHDAR